MTKNVTAMFASLTLIFAFPAFSGTAAPSDVKGCHCAGGTCTCPAGQCACKGCPKVAAEKLTAAMEAIEAAEKAVHAGDSKTALAELARAEAAISAIQAPAKQATTQPAGVSNSRCPIMGSKLPPNVPDSLTREFNGQKIGFCCGGCPLAWDKLSEAEKQAALDKIK